MRAAFGERVLQRANRAAMLDIELLEEQDCFIPHATMTAFLDEVARLAGTAHLGLMLAPHLSIARFGCWGDYVLGAGSLGAAVERAKGAIGFHSRGDRVSLCVGRDEALIGYVSAARGLSGYPHVACGAAGVILSLCRSYLPAGWRPRRIELDIPPPHRPAPFEDVLGCPVVFDAPAVAVVLVPENLDARIARSRDRPSVTVEDLARSRLDPAGRDRFAGVIAEQVRAQVATGEVSIGSAARALGTSVRTLQRELNREGTDFRSLAAVARARRAIELLRGTGVSITAISAELGYSAPAHFARAFRKATGLTPQDFRRTTGYARTAANGQALKNCL